MTQSIAEARARALLTTSQRWVVKIGSALLTNDGDGLDGSRIGEWVQQICELKRAGLDLVLVSSGAVAVGMAKLGWDERPATMQLLQAAAAVGQTSLVKIYQDCFQRFGVHTAQVLLTHEDLTDRNRYLNARNTLRTLLSLGVVPVVNENDTVTTDETRFGDNDTLGALVTNLIEADALILLTDQDGLYDANPAKHADAQLIHHAQSTDMRLSAAAGTGGKLGRGGMITKIKAARLAARSGAVTLIAGGRLDDILLQIKHGDRVGTCLEPEFQPLVARKQWLAGHLQTKGDILIDEGASNALLRQGKSLLAVGVISVSGTFQRGDCVVVKTSGGRPIAHGLTNYTSADARKIMGQSTQKIESILGYLNEDELIHRDNLVLL